jgi:hypothetical protein
MNALLMLKDFAGRVASATRGVHEEIGGLRARLAELREARKVVQLAPLPADEIRDHIATLVGDRGDKWMADHGEELLRDPRPGWRALGAYAGRGRFAVPVGVERDYFGFVCATDPERAQQMLDALAERVEFTPGLPAADRPGELARIERELAQAEAAEERAIDEAAAAGVTISHRAEVVQRRQAEARARELEEQRVADRARRQADLDAQHQEGGQRGRPHYLAETTRKPDPV